MGIGPPYSLSNVPLEVMPSLSAKYLGPQRLEW